MECIQCNKVMYICDIYISVLVSGHIYFIFFEQNRWSDALENYLWRTLSLSDDQQRIAQSHTLHLHKKYKINWDKRIPCQSTKYICNPALSTHHFSWPPISIHKIWRLLCKIGCLLCISIDWYDFCFNGINIRREKCFQTQTRLTDLFCMFCASAVFKAETPVNFCQKFLIQIRFRDGLIIKSSNPMPSNDIIFSKSIKGTFIGIPSLICC